MGGGCDRARRELIEASLAQMRAAQATLERALASCGGAAADAPERRDGAGAGAPDPDLETRYRTLLARYERDTQAWLAFKRWWKRALLERRRGHSAVDPAPAADGPVGADIAEMVSACREAAPDVPEDISYAESATPRSPRRRPRLVKPPLWSPRRQTGMWRTAARRPLLRLAARQGETDDISCGIARASGKCCAVTRSYSRGWDATRASRARGNDGEIYHLTRSPPWTAARIGNACTLLTAHAVMMYVLVGFPPADSQYYRAIGRSAPRAKPVWASPSPPSSPSHREQARRQATSRHRSAQEPDPTPPDYWYAAPPPVHANQQGAHIPLHTRGPGNQPAVIM